MKNDFCIRGLSVAVVLALAPALVSCTTSAEREMEAKVQAEPAPQGPDAIAARGAQAFLNSTSLTNEQKERLLSIHARVYADSVAIRNEIGQAKSLIFKTIAAPKYKKDDISILKKKIVSLDQKRLETMFKALDDVEAVIGHGPETENIYRRLHEFESIRFSELRFRN